MTTYESLDRECRKVGKYARKGDPNRAFALCRKLVEQADSHYGIAHATMGQLYAMDFDFEEAAKWYGAAVLRDPGNVDIWSNLASAYVECNNLTDAAHAAANVLMVQPDHHASRYALAHACLKSGAWKKGWEYWQSGYYLDRFTPRCAGVGELWKGDAVPGKRLLIHWSQGLGDTIQFLRFIPRILEAAQAGSVVLEVQPQLSELCKLQWPALEVVEYDHSNPKVLPEFDFKVDLMHAPHYLGLKDDFEHTMRDPYLGAEVGEMYPREPNSRLRVGVAWQGNRTQERDRYRSIPFPVFECLFDEKRVDWYAVQKGERANHPDVIDLDGEMDSMRDAVAWLKSMDLFITVDTGIAHLALACGIKTWVLLQKHADWRWMDREHTVWYPEARLFVAEGNLNWTPTIEAVKQHVGVFAR